MKRWNSPILLICVIATLEYVNCGDSKSEGSRCPRSAGDVLARFSEDRMLHVRKRRGTAQETTEEYMETIEEVENAQKSLINDELTREEKRKLKGDLNSSLKKFCDLVGYKDDVKSEYCGKYRAIDGVCNNKEYPNWGRAGYAYQRLLSGRYKDKVSQPRFYPKSASARAVSLAFTKSGEVETSTHGASELVMHFGQFLDHDINLTPAANVTCECDDENRDPLCFPIECEEGDPMCGTKSCIEFRRSRPTINGDCTAGPRTHENTITSFVDASNVYGSFPEEAEELHDKTKGRGLMLVDEQPIDEGHIHLLPPDRENGECVTLGDNVHCGRGGDVRAAEQPGLTSLHTIFVREHNRVATMLHALNEHWDDHRLYQETRRIVIAVWQKVVYGEWLPIVLGRKTMDETKLGLWCDYEGYDETINPTLFNEFASAFMRFGHSMIPERLKRVTSIHKHNEFPSIELRSAFFNAAHMYEMEYGSVSSLLLGMISTELLPVDEHFSDAISKQLFEDPETREGGLDLIALNIQRGRDHGLPPYIAYMRKAGLTVPEEWSDLKKIMASDTVDTLEEVYRYQRTIFTSAPTDCSQAEMYTLAVYPPAGEYPLGGGLIILNHGAPIGKVPYSVTPLESLSANKMGLLKLRRIDVFVGFIAEKPMQGALVGPTAAWVLAKQFKNLKYGDRYWFENTEGEQAFTADQLAAINEVTMARLICDNIRVESIQPAVFKVPDREVGDNGDRPFYQRLLEGTGCLDENGGLNGFSNHRVRCDEFDKIPELSLAAWKENTRGK